MHTRSSCVLTIVSSLLEISAGRCWMAYSRHGEVQTKLTTLFPYGGTRMKVRFNVVSEFVEELELDKDVVEDKILRVSRLYEHTHTAPLVHLYVLATAVVRSKIVYLRQFCGQMFDRHPGVEHEPTTQERTAERIQETLTQEAARLGFTIRAGVLEE